MATCYDEAVEIYRRYSKNIIGVISDVGFVLHKNDAPETEKLDAGIDLCRLIREDCPTMPVLMQSSQESVRKTAQQLGAGFVVKSSKTLTQQLSDYIGREFGFGDFVAIDPKTGKEIGRANDLEGFEHIISTIPPKAFRRLSDNNYLSKWLFARGLFAGCSPDQHPPHPRLSCQSGAGSGGEIQPRDVERHYLVLALGQQLTRRQSTRTRFS